MSHCIRRFINKLHTNLVKVLNKLLNTPTYNGIETSHPNIYLKTFFSYINYVLDFRIEPPLKVVFVQIRGLLVQKTNQQVNTVPTSTMYILYSSLN